MKNMKNMPSLVVSVSLLLISLYAAGGYMEYRLTRCVFNSTEPNDSEFVDSYYHNKILYTKFSSSVGKFVGETEPGMKNAEAWNNNNLFLAAERAGKERFCATYIEDAYSLALTKSAKPYVVLYSMTTPGSKHPAILVCSIYDFYPKLIKVFWVNDGQEVPTGVTSTEELADGDWYYQIHSYLEYMPRSGQNISCVVEHASLKQPLVTVWDPSMPESERNKIAIGASGLILGLTLSLAGFIYYRRKSRGRILVPNH